MTKNKIFFTILALIVIGAVFYFAINLNDTKNTRPTTSSWDFNVWIREDKTEPMKQYIEEFKKKYTQYADTNIAVESFADAHSYTNAFFSASLSWKAPDIFVLENSERSPMKQQIQVIDPSIVTPNTFRLWFKSVFWDDLIVPDPEDAALEYLIGIPMWYESLGIFYNRKYFSRPTDMGTWENMVQEIQAISEKFEDITPIALGNGSSVLRAADIMARLLVLEWASSLFDTSSSYIKQAFSFYTAFWEEQGGNNYNNISLPFSGERDVELFTQGNVASMIGYPRDLIEIDEIGYQKNFLFAMPFPWYAGKEKVSAIKYYYYALNKDSKNTKLGQDLLGFMASVEWQKLFLEKFPYYLPAETSLEKEIGERKILPEYNITYNNFIDPVETLISYDMADAEYFRKGIVPILDTTTTQEQKMEWLKSFILCSTTKHETLLNLSSPCE